jgi:hypothetical protein
MAARIGAVALAAAVLAGLGGCTTLEGNNAFTDMDAFEDDVLVGTLQGIGFVPYETKDPIETTRGPLVMPGDTENLPRPQEDFSEVMIPQDSDRPTLDTTGLTDQDLVLLGRIRVADDASDPYSNRQPEEQELRRLVGQMQATRGIRNTGQRPLYLPPERYFTTVDDNELVCLAENGDLVPVSDPACPAAIRQALLSGQDG